MEPDRFALRRARYPFFDLFDGCVISGIEGVAKPDQQIFEILLERHQLDPRRTAFIDDSPRNIAAAQALGIEAVPFVSPAELRDDLRRYGIAI